MQLKKLSKNKVNSIINKKDWTYVPGPKMGTNNFMYGVELGSFKSSKKVKVVTQGKKNGF